MALKDDPRIIEFRTQLEKRAKELTEYVAKGKCGSFDEYRRYCGRISGLGESDELLLDVLKNYRDGDDDDDDL